MALPEGQKVASFVVGLAVVPAAPDDANPLESQGAQDDVVGNARQDRPGHGQQIAEALAAFIQARESYLRALTDLRPKLTDLAAQVHEHDHLSPIQKYPRHRPRPHVFRRSPACLTSTPYLGHFSTDADCHRQLDSRRTSRPPAGARDRAGPRARA